MAVLHLGTGLIPFAVASLTGIHDVDGELLVDALGRLIECQLHDVLKKTKQVLSVILSAAMTTVMPWTAGSGWHFGYRTSRRGDSL